MLSLNPLIAAALSLAPGFEILEGEEALEAPSVKSEFTLFTGATIHLGDAKGSRASALLVAGGKVVEFGAEHEFAERRLDSDWEVVDLHGAYVVPGLQDAHCEVSLLGRRLSEIDLSGLVGSEAIVEHIVSRSTAVEEGRWILAHGWEPDELPGPDSELAKELASRYPNNPVRISHIDRSVAFLNRRALMVAGFDESRPHSVHGGHFERDEEGKPTGLVFGKALEQVERVLPSRSRSDVQGEILAAQELLLSLGITAVHDMGVGRESEEAYRALVSDGRLQMRVIGYLDGRRELRNEWLQRGPVAPDEFDRFCIQGVALDADGSLALRTANLLRGYLDARQRKADWLLTDSDLRDRIAKSMAAGLQPVVYATGDRACRTVLDVYEEFTIANPESRRLRPRLEGVLLVSPKDWARFPGLGVLPSMQPLESMTDWIERRVEQDQVRGALAWRDVAPNIGRFALGSRSPSRSPDPLVGLHAARVLAGQAPKHPDVSEEKRDLVNARAALAGYTAGAAYASHQEDRRGQLFEGFWADMTVFDKSPVEGELDELLQANVLMTIIGGEIVWTADH